MPATRPQFVLAILVALTLGIAVRALNVDNVEARTVDERVYARQARVWLAAGKPGVRALVEEYKRDPVTRHGPMPTRAGMTQLVAAVMTLKGRYDAAVGASISFVASVASLLVVALIGIRFLPQWATPPALLLYAVFPPELVIARRTWTDALVELLALLLVWFVCEIMRDSSRRIWYAAFAIVASLSITIKESMAVPIAVCGLWALWILIGRRREVINATILVAGSAIACGLSVTWLAFTAGSFADLASLVTGIARVNAANPYAIKYASGPGYLILEAFWIVSPGVSLLCVAGVAAGFSKAHFVTTDQYRTTMWIGTFTLANVAIAMMVPHWLNLRYVSVAFGTACLLAGVGVEYMFVSFWRQFSPPRRTAFVILFITIILGSVARDYRYFHNEFVIKGTPDMPVGMLRLPRSQTTPPSLGPGVSVD